MKHIKYLVFFILTLASCKKEFEGVRPDAKINQLRDQYSQQLTGAKNGWIGYLFPAGGGGYTFKFTFNDKHRVKTYATIDAKKAESPDESSYRLVADQLVSLYFDTYSYLHQLADPDESKSGGRRGGGKISDFEFAIIESSTDTMKLRGNHNESQLILIRAKDNEGDNFIKDAFNLNNKIDDINQLRHYYNNVKLNNKEYGAIINTELNTISFYHSENGLFNSFYSEYAMSSKGIVLKTPFIAGNLRINYIDDFNINKTSNSATAKINGKTEIKFSNSDKPLIIDKEAPRRMYLTNKNHTSSHGFTIAGKKDAVGIRKFPLFNFLVFVPRRYIDPIDALYVIYEEDLNVGPLFTTNYNDQGILSFKPIRLLTGIDPGEELEKIIIQQNNLWFDPNGFYVYQTGKENYDLVSIKDSKVWIRFN